MCVLADSIGGNEKGQT